MPYPNEHAARIKDPGSFDPKSFRSKEITSGVRIITAKLSNGNGSMVVQAYRFSSDKFTVEQAKKWLKDHDVSYILFEPASELKHVGVLGMHWGHRKSDPYPGISKSTQHLAKKDAQRHVDAKMFYGETAGTKRKLLKAEIEKKKKTIPGYETVFNDQIGKVDAAKSAKKAVRTRTLIDTGKKGRSFVKKILGVTGPLTVAVASAAYLANKPRVDAFIYEKTGFHVP